MQLAKELFQLQELELDLESHLMQASKLRAILQDDSALKQAENVLAEAAALLKEQQAALRELESQSADLDAKINEVKKSLYSGRISNPKELSNLSREQESLEAKRTQVDDQALEGMDRLEELQTNCNQIMENLVAVRALWQQSQTQNTQALELTLSEIEKLKNELHEFLTRFDQSDLALFQTLRKSKGRAVSKVEQGNCRGCGLKLTAAWIQRARAGTLVQCSGCQRILYLD
ncbi:zinc ribbon domain-containing protein [Dehalococcoides mccartyi]|jgi:hypothetical protein|uniref:zinc ribbon domain-containing protein n=1 Tax=Dehalococcoides mccartyi TaxID=61435 RepID=UPI0003C82135|nr:C4-type zinc ribbon domain-containing protein [Dehalococcoides mccartyi]AHB13067.1 hypothetical protein GY50_0284 [Dehalococcoides mccartyi GY50]AII57511.1 hypothetical protein X792_01720 [Dehalococcoides mccartyi CG1]APH12003.1 hypothetical protein ASJ33_01980 [Dehalococcoides mccartyi]